MVFVFLRRIKFHNNVVVNVPTSSEDDTRNLGYNTDGTRILGRSPNRALPVSERARKSLKEKVLGRVFSEDYEREKNRIWDPQGPIIHTWSRIFLLACVASIFVDPLFFFMPIVRQELCIDIGATLKILTIIRSILDLFYVIQIYVKFNTAYVAPSSRIFGRGELVIEPSKIAIRYLCRGFWIDLFAALPLPQVLFWVVIPNLRGSLMSTTDGALWFVIMIQYIPRAILILPLSSQFVEATGILTERAWTGAAYNFVLYMMASHVVGSFWYILSVDRQTTCWREACAIESTCQPSFFDCGSLQDPTRDSWFQSTNVTTNCVASTTNPSPFFNFGMYLLALPTNFTGSAFINKYFYCYWWGLQSLSSFGQNLGTSIYIGETIFTTTMVTVALILFALLIGNMQRFLFSTSIRIEEWRIKRNDTEQWMHFRQLPPELRKTIRQYDQYKWVATRGVDEEVILQGLPMDLRRKVKRHLSLSLVRRVPLFDQMDETMLDAICERLKPALCTKNMFLVREGDPVNQMLFVIRGRLDSFTTSDGRTGFFNSCTIGPGDFCGEELLTWALDPRPDVVLPSSTRSVKAVTEVEAFALVAEDLKFVASQFRRLHSKELKHKFRFYSHQWRTWAACFIQAAWRRHKKKKAAQLRVSEHELPQPQGCSFWDVYAERLVQSSLSFRKNVGAGSGPLQKPEEPDFPEDE